MYDDDESYAASESTRAGGKASSAGGGGIDKMQIQDLLGKNPECECCGENMAASPTLSTPKSILKVLSFTVTRVAWYM